MNYKRLLCGIGALTVCFMLTGCELMHRWEAASCTTPKTCSECGEVRGEALGHTWVEASCAAPKTCSRCGITEGEALAHTLTKATYQQAPICEVCGQTVGKPLQADFEKYNLTKYIAQPDREYDYKTICYKNSANTTIGKVKFSNYRTFESDKTHPAQEGYEWQAVDVTLAFGDGNAWNYGMELDFCYENYYDIIQNDESVLYDDENVRHFTVNWNGVDYTECRENISSVKWGDWTANTNSVYGGWKNYIEVKYSAAVLVPVGYDGYVLGVRNKAAKWNDGQHIFDLDNTDTVFFRFQ